MTDTIIALISSIKEFTSCGVVAVLNPVLATKFQMT